MMSLVVVASLIGLAGISIYTYAFFRGWDNWDDWAFSMVLKNAGFVVIVISLTLFIVWYVQP
jgi:hypothetical protein